jgi:hypothetical protein
VRRRTGYLLVVLLLTTHPLSPGVLESAEPGSSKVGEGKVTVPSEVELDIYSGRENPRFTLGSAETTELERKVAALPPLVEDIAPRNSLGYRGIHVRGGDTFADLVVSAGVVEIRDRLGNMTRKSDPGRQLERWLIDAGAGQLQQSEVDVVRHDLGH